MPIFNAPNLTNGIDSTLTSLASEVPPFIPMLLIFIFGTVFIGGIVAQKRRIGVADFPMWSVIASISTLLVAMPMTLIKGLVQLPVLSIVVVVTIASGFWLFNDRNRNEV